MGKLAGSSLSTTLPAMPWANLLYHPQKSPPLQEKWLGLSGLLSNVDQI